MHDALRRPVVRVAGLLWLLGTLVLSSPVLDLRDRATGTVQPFCGLTLPRAVAVDVPDDDCTERARSRVGWGVLLLVLAVPFGTVAVLTDDRRDDR